MVANGLLLDMFYSYPHTRESIRNADGSPRAFRHPDYLRAVRIEPDTESAPGEAYVYAFWERAESGSPPVGGSPAPV